MPDPKDEGLSPELLGVLEAGQQLALRLEKAAAVSGYKLQEDDAALTRWAQAVVLLRRAEARPRSELEAELLELRGREARTRSVLLKVKERLDLAIDFNNYEESPWRWTVGSKAQELYDVEKERAWTRTTRALPEVGRRCWGWFRTVNLETIKRRTIRHAVGGWEVEGQPGRGWEPIAWQYEYVPEDPAEEDLRCG